MVSFGGKTVDMFEDDGVRWFSVKDIGSCLKHSNMRSLISRYPEVDKKKVRRSTRGGPQQVVYISEAAVKRLCIYSRKLVPDELAVYLNIAVHETKYNSVEGDTIAKIMSTFCGEEMVPQYAVNNYRIDLYFPKYQIAVECDEEHHKRYKAKDEEREAYIKQKLGCTFVRYEPHDENFQMEAVCNRIFREIMNSITGSRATVQQP